MPQSHPVYLLRFRYCYYWFLMCQRSHEPTALPAVTASGNTPTSTSRGREITVTVFIPLFRSTPDLQLDMVIKVPLLWISTSFPSSSHLSACSFNCEDCDSILWRVFTVPSRVVWTCLMKCAFMLLWESAKGGEEEEEKETFWQTCSLKSAH